MHKYNQINTDLKKKKILKDTLKNTVAFFFFGKGLLTFKYISLSFKKKNFFFT